jgi:hypothetical protein
MEELLVKWMLEQHLTSSRERRLPGSYSAAIGACLYRGWPTPGLPRVLLRDWYRGWDDLG